MPIWIAPDVLVSDVAAYNIFTRAGVQSMNSEIGKRNCTGRDTQFSIAHTLGIELRKIKGRKLEMGGYSVIGLHNPKCGANVGGVMRAAGCYGSSLIIISGARYKTFKKFPTDTMKIWRHIPIQETDDLMSHIPHACVPVAVDFLEGAKPLPRYRHPDRAFYIFGAEDETLSKKIVDRCVDKIYIPIKVCMNLASCVNVVLYDRLSKTNSYERR